MKLQKFEVMQKKKYFKKMHSGLNLKTDISDL